MSLRCQQNPFVFVPDISLQGFRELWQNRIAKARNKFVDLQQELADYDIRSYLEELNQFDKFIEGEVRGEMWQDLHPDADFRQEAATAKKAFITLEAEVNASAAIASNIVKLEATGHVIKDDEKRFLADWKRQLRNGGANLSPQNKQRVMALSTKIEEAEDQFSDNIRNYDEKLELNVDELLGVPEDYLASHPANLMTGRVILEAKDAHMGPVSEYCQIQKTREKVYRFQSRTAEATNGPLLVKLLNLRARKADLLGYQNWAECQLQNTMAKSVANVTAFLEDAYEAIRPIAEREKEQIIEALKQKEGVVAQPWDMKYGLALLKNYQLGGFDIKSTRQYFQMSRVLPALLHLVELDLHTATYNNETEILDLVLATHRKYGTFEPDRGMKTHLSLWHLGMSEYAGRLYSYLFGKVICHDLFNEFQKGGNIMDPNVAKRYRTLVLEKVGSQDADDSVSGFLGRKYNSKAFQDWLNGAS
ncbi:hypothetical protein QFC19_008215 [Naganishia cerealis]|uniref:Uncharacterized protein n=1 Tax=Naganishia cerealis TaxID=610337 RepID=A0ACC2V345_9TREE|nr:hypothetical protein QFC19_008215 [Naganishia cerealis]